MLKRRIEETRMDTTQVLLLGVMPRVTTSWFGCHRQSLRASPPLNHLSLESTPKTQQRFTFSCVPCLTVLTKHTCRDDGDVSDVAFAAFESYGAFKSDSVNSAAGAFVSQSCARGGDRNNRKSLRHSGTT